MGCTHNSFRQFGNGQHVGRITVILHHEDLLEDGDCKRVISWTQDRGFTLQESIVLVIIDGKHQHASIDELREDMGERFNWMRQRSPV